MARGGAAQTTGHLIAERPIAGFPGVDGTRGVFTQIRFKLCGDHCDSVTPGLTWGPFGVEAIGTTVFKDATSPGFDFVVGNFTNGVVDEVSEDNEPVTGGGGDHGEPEPLWLGPDVGPNGIDLQGFRIDRIGLRIDTLTFTSPGRNPNGDGLWTDTTISGAFLFEGACATPPTIGAAPPVVVETCASGPATVTLTAPPASSACGEPVTVTGVVISSVPPISVMGGQVSLPPGVHTVRWTASDGAQTTTTTETVTVQPSVLVSGQFLLRDRAQVRTVSNALAGIGSAGSLVTDVGNDTKLGDVTSVPPVVIRDRATVQGSIRSAGAITLGNGDVITGPVVPFTTVSLPPIPNLAGVVFPPPTGGNRTFNSSPTVVALSPGSYGQVTLNSGARVSFSAGTYFFQQLAINASAFPTAGSGVRIFVSGALTFQSAFLTATGTPAQLFLGYAGSNPAVLEAPFQGTLVAPAGAMSLGTATARDFRGRFFARSLEVRPDVHLVCDAAVTAR
jgi:hypothetical protein